MIGYVCKYTPVELLEALGARMELLEPSVTDFNQADTRMHPNICSYVKGVLEEMTAGEYEGVVLTTCCDSVRRLYDVLKEQYPDKFLYLLDIPRKVNDYSVSLYEKRLADLADSYRAYREGKTVRNQSGTEEPGQEAGEEKPEAAAEKSGQEKSGKGKPGAGKEEDCLKELDLLVRRKIEGASLRTAPEEEGRLRIGLMGSRCPKSVRALLAARGASLAFDLTCSGRERGKQLEGYLSAGGPAPERYLEKYAEALLCQIPCVRMVKATGREQFLEGMKDSVDGIVYHTVKFCDMYTYEYTRLNQKGEVPLLKVETDLTTQCEGQIRTRVEAFLEARDSRKTGGRKIQEKQKEGIGKLTGIYVMGVDSGSTSTNAVILNEKKEIVGDAVIRTGAKTAESAGKILQMVLEKAGLGREDLSMIVSTGYGRVSIPYADRNVTEISCHGKGAIYFNPEVRTILDIGGQDSKAIRLNEKGEVTDFVMNDKCAAGTGRFLEAMARTLELSIEELGPVSLKAEEEVQISSMCTVFAESEVISLIAQNKEKADIACGVHSAIAGKACSLLKRVGVSPVVMMSGGVARNPGVVNAIEKRLGEKLYVCENPDLVGAVGAALFALEELQEKDG